MKKTIASLVVLMSAFQAVAQEETKIETRTQATGRENAIYLSVSSCSIPPLYPLAYGMSFASVSSNFEYKVCREYSTAEYEVTGSGWNKERKEIAGTARLTYRLENATKGSSQYLSGDEDGIDPIMYALAVSNVSANCRNLRELVAQQAVDLSQTQCR